MATAIRELRRPSPRAERDDLLSRYRAALARYGDPEAERRDLPPGTDVRTCASCGERTTFRVDPAGGWAECAACGAIA
jgi:hypothetical protein